MDGFAASLLGLDVGDRFIRALQMHADGDITKDQLYDALPWNVDRRFVTYVAVHDDGLLPIPELLRRYADDSQKGN